MKTKYRIITGDFQGYEYHVQIWRWWWPFWSFSNYASSIEEGEGIIRKYARMYKVVATYKLLTGGNPE